MLLQQLTVTLGLLAAFVAGPAQHTEPLHQVPVCIINAGSENQQPCPDTEDLEAYRETYHIPVPACTLDMQRVSPDGVVLCDETGQKPTKSQLGVWDGFITWHSCIVSHDKYACLMLGFSR